MSADYVYWLLPASRSSSGSHSSPDLKDRGFLALCYKMKKWHRILGIVTIAVWVVLLVGHLASPYYFRSKFRDEPQLYVLPQQLSLESIAPCKTNIVINGYSFGFPWENCTHVYNSTNRTAGGGMYTFENGRKVIVFIHPTNGDKNPYHIYKSIHSASPHDFRAFQSSDEIEKVIDRLMCKSAIGVFPYSSTYEFKSNCFNGFQIGNPKIDSHVEVDVFDTDGNQVHLMMPVGEKNENPLTQDQVNCIIASLKKE